MRSLSGLLKNSSTAMFILKVKFDEEKHSKTNSKTGEVIL